MLAVHNAVIGEHGGSPGLRDVALLESALARPQQADAYAEPSLDMPHLAAMYALGISRNHPCIDGNKRVALVMLETFLVMNGHELVASDADCATVMWALAAGELSDTQFMEWVRTHARST